MIILHLEASLNNLVASGSISISMKKLQSGKRLFFMGRWRDYTHTDVLLKNVIFLLEKS